MALSDGGLAVAECPEEDDWESAAEGPELDNLPQNAVEDISGTTVPTMPLVRVIVEDKGAEICLMHSRCLIWLRILPLQEGIAAESGTAKSQCLVQLPSAQRLLWVRSCAEQFFFSRL